MTSFIIPPNATLRDSLELLHNSLLLQYNELNNKSVQLLNRTSRFEVRHLIGNIKVLVQYYTGAINLIYLKYRYNILSPPINSTKRGMNEISRLVIQDIENIDNLYTRVTCQMRRPRRRGRIVRLAQFGMESFQTAKNSYEVSNSSPNINSSTQYYNSDNSSISDDDFEQRVETEVQRRLEARTSRGSSFEYPPSYHSSVHASSKY